MLHSIVATVTSHATQASTPTPAPARAEPVTAPPPSPTSTRSSLTTLSGLQTKATGNTLWDKLQERVQQVELQHAHPNSSHLYPQLPPPSQAKVTGISVNVKVSGLPPQQTGENAPLVFAALNPSFDDGTWAHGGLIQDGSGLQGNFGGLVNTGGGSGDYTSATADPNKLVQKIVNPPDKQRTQPLAWKQNTTYNLSIQHVGTTTLQPGEYPGIGGQSGKITQPTIYDEWQYTLTDPATGKVVQQSTIYNHADAIDPNNTSYWTETQQLPASQKVTTTWSDPTYTTSDGATHPITSAIVDYEAQRSASNPGGATAPSWSTSDTQLLDPNGLVIQQNFGVQRTTAEGTQLTTSGVRPPAGSATDSTGN